MSTAQTNEMQLFNAVCILIFFLQLTYYNQVLMRDILQVLNFSKFRI